jgi:hypothetical protein
MNALNEARAKVAQVRAAIADDDAVVRAVHEESAALQAKIDALRKQHASKGLRGQLADALAALAVAEEQAIEQLAIDLAGQIVQRQATDPVRHYEWIIANVAKLRASVRSEIDTPNNQKYRVHPLVMQALALQPKPDELDTPLNQLLGSLACDWPQRRSQILAQAETNSPFEAA